MEVDTMDRIAFIIGETFIYWSSIILTLAAASAICLFVSFALKQGIHAVTISTVIPLAMVFSLSLPGSCTGTAVLTAM